MNLPYEYSSEFRQAMCPIQVRFLEGTRGGQPQQVRFEAALCKLQELTEVHRRFLQFSPLPPADQGEYLREIICRTCEELRLVAGPRYPELLAQRDALIEQMVGVRREPATVTSEARSETITTMGDRGERGTTGLGQSLPAVLKDGRDPPATEFRSTSARLRGTPGPKPDRDAARQVLTIVNRVAGGGHWKAKLYEICEALEEAKIPYPNTWSKRDLGIGSWTDAAALEPELAIKAITYRLKTAQA